MRNSISFVVVLALTTIAGAQLSDEDPVARLKFMEDGTKDKVIPFSKQDFEQLGFAQNRDFILVPYLYAKSLLDNPQLQLKKVAKEFAIAVQAFKRGDEADKLFFVSIAFEDYQDLFKRLGLNQAPFIFTWHPHMAPKASGLIELAAENQMSPSKTPGYPWNAEDFVRFISGQTGKKPGEVVRPTILNDPMFPLYAFLALLFLGATAYRAYHSPFVRMPIFWLLGSLTVYWFATSGGLFNIIRGMPMYFINQQGKLQFFLQGRQGQLGIEGFIMGGSYVVLSSLLAAFTYGAPRIKDPGPRKALSIFIIVLVSLVFYKIFSTFTFKNNGYWIRHFFF